MVGNAREPEQDKLTLPVLEEQLSVGIHKVDTGRGVRIHKTVTERPATIDERLLRDEVVVRHVAVDRMVEAGQAPTTRYEGDTLVVPVLEEVVVVERRLRLKEELHITKVRHEQRHLDTVMLKSEQINVERFDDAGKPPTGDLSTFGGSIMQHTLVAVFDNRSDAEHALDELLASGFSRLEVQISNADATGQTDSVTGRPTTSVASDTTDEGIGSSIRHFFGSIFGTDSSDHVQKYSDAVSRGHHVLTVNASDEPEVERAADIVERHGPVDIDERAAQWAGGAATARPESMRMSGAGGMQQSASVAMQADKTGDRNLYQQQSLNDPTPMGGTYQEPMSDGGNLSSGTSGASLQGSSSAGSAMAGGSAQQQGSQQRDTSTTSTTGTTGTTGSTVATGATAIPVVEEQLKVGKREVQRGGVRVFSRVVETPVHESIGLREEHVNVERHRIDQPISTNDATAFKEQQIEMRETDEEAVVEKSARVVEEVVVGKQVSERQQQIDDTVRHTEIDVQLLDAGRSGMDDDAYFRSDWQTNYGAGGGRYEDYAPAYSYGSQMRRSDKYRGRQWNEVESDLRSDWESRNPGGGASAWEKMKNAIRSGWERLAGGTDDDTRYRTHWTSNYGTSGGTYDEYRPAYSYGSEMRNSDKYRGRQWHDVESDLRSDWDTRYGSGTGSTWERFKAAIRHGWDRITD
jgi:uncharacterized protein (TIGR02271 family)